MLVHGDWVRRQSDGGCKKKKQQADPSIDYPVIFPPYKMLFPKTSGDRDWRSRSRLLLNGPIEIRFLLLS